MNEYYFLCDYGFAIDNDIKCIYLLGNMSFFKKAGCALGISGCGGGGTEDIEQCEEMDKKLKEEYGDDYRTNREKFPLTSMSLQQIKSTGCETYYGYDALAKEFCASLDNYTTQIGGGHTCGSYADPDNTMRSKWCLNYEGNGDQATNRMRGDSRCSEENLGDKYHMTASKYCKTHPEENWCTCYNMKNKVCDTNPDAAGCAYYKILDQNQNAFGPRVEREVPSEQEGEPPTIEYDPPVAYKILREMGHCRPRSCDDGYIPENVKSDCESTYKICGKDIDIRTHDNMNIILKCNAGTQKPIELPDWWDEEDDGSFWDEAREPPFDKPPFNMLPITRIPPKFKWRDANVRYLTYYTTACSSICCIVILLIMKSLKR